MNSLLFQVCLVSTWAAGLWAVTDRRLSQTQHKTPADRLLSQKTTYYYQDASSSVLLGLESYVPKGFKVSRTIPTNDKSPVTSLESILKEIGLECNSENLKTIREHIEKLFASPAVDSAKFLELTKDGNSNIIKHFWDGPVWVSGSCPSKQNNQIGLLYIAVPQAIPNRWPRIRIDREGLRDFPEADDLKKALFGITKITFPKKWIEDVIDHLKLAKTKRVILQLSSRELPGTAPEEEVFGFVESLKGQSHLDLVFKGPDLKNGYFVNYRTDEYSDRTVPQIADIEDASGQIIWIRNTDPKDQTQKIVMKKIKETQLVLDDNHLIQIIARLTGQSSDAVSPDTIKQLKTLMTKEKELDWTTITTPGWPVKSAQKIRV